MKRGETYSSGFLKAQDLLDQGRADGITLTIKAIKSSQMDDGNVQRVLSFNEDERELGLNVTNWDSIAAITGEDDDDNWVGHRIHVFPHRLDRPFNGKTHGIRVRAPGGAAPAPSRPALAALNDMTLDQAVQACADVGITKPELIAHLKAKGLNGYSPARDTAVVKSFINSKKAEQAPFENEQVFQEADIPF